MTKQQRAKWMDWCVSREETILDHFARNPETKPDGSFIMELVLKAHRAGERVGRNASKGGTN